MHSKNQKRHSSPVPSRSPLVPMKPKALAGAAGTGDVLPFRVPKDYPHSRFNKAPLAVYPPKGARSKPCVSLPVVSLEKMPGLGRPDATSSHVRLCSSSPSPGDKLANGRGAAGAPASPPSSSSSSSSFISTDGRPSPVRSPLDRRQTAAPSPLDRRPPPSKRAPAPSLPSSTSPLERKAENGTKPSSKRTHSRLSGRVFDPNKHCGVQDPESKRPCTRSLTCKTHSLTHRRAVPGRRKHFDILLAEHKGRPKEKEKDKEATKEKEREAGLEKKEGGSQSVTSHETTSPRKPHCPSSRSLSTLKLRLANAHIPRVPGSTSTSLPTAPVPASTSDPSSHSWNRTPGDNGRLSSDEGDPDTPEDMNRSAYSYSTHHPRPLGCCVFRSRRMGRGHYVFDRRWDRMRLALQNMVEKHLNAQMWRKVPLAAESFLPSGASDFQHPSLSPSPTSVTPPLLSFPSAFPSSSNSFSYAAVFPQSASVAGVFSIRDAPVATAGKPRGAPYKASRPCRDREHSAVAAKRRKNTFPSSSSADNFKRNGSSHHPAFQGSGATTASPGQKNGLGHGDSGLGTRQEDRFSRVDGSQSNGTQNILDEDSISTNSIAFASKKDPASTARTSPTPTSGPPACEAAAAAEGRKRRSPNSYREAVGKLGRQSGLNSLFRKGNTNGGILASGLDSPRPAKLHH